MKIIYPIYARIPTERAHGVQIVKMCEAFALCGHEVELIVPNRKNDLKSDPFDYYSVQKNFVIKKIPFLEIPGCGMFGHAVRLVSFAISASFYVSKNTADVIFTRDEFFCGIASFFKDNIFYEGHSTQDRFFTAHNYKKAKGLITITSGLKKYYIEKYNISDSKILVSPDGVDLQKFNNNVSREEARKKLELSPAKKLVVYTGHLYGWKGTDTLAKAAKFFDENTEFIFVGGTENDLVMFREKYSGFKNIKILGQKSHSEIPFYLASADVLVLPNSGHKNISRFYTSPLKLFEYMASGRPIVASDLPSIREILNEENAVFFEPDNSQSLADAIKKVLSDNELVNKISQQALSDVQDYSWKKRAERIAREMKKI